MRKLVALFALLGLVTSMIGCKAEGKVDDDGVKVKVDDK